MKAPLLQVRNLEVKYHTREGTLTAIRDASFDLHEAEILGVVGESGCGKSTMASAVMRLLPPNGEISSGQILFSGQDLCQLDEEGMRSLRGKDMAMIFQDAMTSLNPVFSVEQQMVDALKAQQLEGVQAGRRTPRERAVEMLDRVGIPDPSRQIKEYPHQFSGGMRQRIMIATALLSNPALLVADEPTSALDVTLEAQILELICGLRDELGTAILYITHDLGVIARLCDRVIVMYAGSIVEAGDVYSIFDQPQHPYTRALLCSHPSHSVRQARLRTIPGRVPSLRDLPAGCKFAPRCEFAQQVCETLEPPSQQVGGHTVMCHVCGHKWAGETRVLFSQPSLSEPAPMESADVAGVTGEVLVDMRALRTHFRDHESLLSQIVGQKGGSVRAVDGVDIQLCRGETLGLVGESGSGKTTLGRTLLRLVDATDGELKIDGQDITRMSQSRLRPMRAQMQMIFQDPFSSLSPRMKVSSILIEPFRIHNVPVDTKQKIDELLEMVGLSAEQADKYPHQLSGGQARRVGIARALALHPDILVADEPTAGLDVSVAAGILNLLKDLRERLNLTYLIITHNLNVLGFIADRVAVMYLGKIVEVAQTEELFTHPKHPYTEALISAVPIPDPRLREQRQHIILEGEIPSARTPPPGCPFHPRCRYAEQRCTTDVPALREVQQSGHLSACHFPERVQMQLAM
ncbi:MAG TPA: ABC transporter ATP-binding protein [Anaerolineae bacterium]|nr:ABC transporter ATP-binding protein [Anaerolineae bacterium]